MSKYQHRSWNKPKSSFRDGWPRRCIRTLILMDGPRYDRIMRFALCELRFQHVGPHRSADGREWTDEDAQAAEDLWRANAPRGYKRLLFIEGGPSRGRITPPRRSDGDQAPP